MTVPVGPALAFATGVIVTIEFSAAGLLPDLAGGLGVGLAEAGWLASGFAFASAVAGPPLTTWADRFDRRLALAGVLALFGATNLLAAAAPDFRLLLGIRILQGAALPAFVSLAIAALVAARPGEPQGRSLAQLNAGVVAGAVVALPAAVLLAGRLDWRACFAALGLLALLAAALVWRAAPAGRASPAADGEAWAVLRRPGVFGHLALSALVFTALFCSYTYLTAYLARVAGLSPAGVALILALFAAAGLAGNLLMGRLPDAAALAATAAAMPVFALVMAGVAASKGALPAVGMLILAWGGLHAGLFVACQTRLLTAAPAAPAFASSLNIAASNVGIALGALIGGGLAETGGLTTPMWGAAGLGLLAAGLALALGAVSLRAAPRRPRSP